MVRVVGALFVVVVCGVFGLAIAAQPRDPPRATRALVRDAARWRYVAPLLGVETDTSAAARSWGTHSYLFLTDETQHLPDPPGARAVWTDPGPAIDAAIRAWGPIGMAP